MFALSWVRKMPDVPTKDVLHGIHGRDGNMDRVAAERLRHHFFAHEQFRKFDDFFSQLERYDSIDPCFGGLALRICGI